MSSALPKRILRQYDIPFSKILPVQKGYRNQSFPVLAGNKTLNLIIYKQESGIVGTIKRANTVADYLAAKGLPVRQTYRPEIVRLRGTHTEIYAALYTYLPGETIAWEAYTRNHLKLLGMVMAQLHAALEPLDLADLPLVTQQYQRIFGRMKRYFADKGVHTAMAKKLHLHVSHKYLDRALAVLRVAEQWPHQQVLHMDLVRGNVLFDESPGRFALGRANLCGILDFEKTAYGHPLFDIARTLAFLLVDCAHKSDAQTRKYFLYSGYVKRGGGAIPRPAKALEELINIFLLHDFYKFLRHNPYESLPDNHHFMPTRDILLQRGILKSL